MPHSNIKMSLGDCGTDISLLVTHYITEHRPTALREKSFFESMPSLELAIHHAAFALDHREPPRRYSHQRRIRRTPMRKAYWFLSKVHAELQEKHTFDELHEYLHTAFSKIHGLGALYTYDTALRIGFYLRLEPTDVYLHAGTREGARAIGVKDLHVVSVKNLPSELHALAPHEIENFLCTFKPRTKG